MKKILLNLKQITLACGLAAACLAAPAAHGQLTTNVFGFQKGNLTKGGLPYGSGSGYSGVLDGRITDNTGTSALTTGLTATIGNAFNAAAGTNGQQHVGLFSYDLTDLNNFITANTSVSSTATVASVSMTVVASSIASGSAQAISLFGTDPFTSSGCTWSNYATATPWTVPFQNLGSPTNTAPFCFTGGGSALTPSLGGSSPLTTVGAGNNLIWTTSANFINAVSNALTRPDKKLYLTARVNFFSTGDTRVNVITSVTNTVPSRPQLLVTVVVNGTPPVSGDLTWVGDVSGTWDTSALNWNDGVGAVAYSNDKNVTFDDTLSISPSTNNNITLSSTFSPSNVIANNSTYSYSLTGGGLAGNMNFTKQGGGTFSLGMSNSYSGLTTVSAGTLVVTHSNALGSVISNTVVANGATLTLGDATTNATVTGETITISGAGVGNIRGALRGAASPAPNVWSGPIIVGDNLVPRIGTEDNGNLTIAGPITDNGNNYIMQYRPGTGGIVTISNNAHSYGATRVFGGRVVMGVNNGFTTNQLQVGGGTIDLNGFNQTIAGLIDVTGGLAVITNSSTTLSTLTFNTPTGTNNSSTNAIRGLVNFVKDGTGNQTLGGGTNRLLHSYSGTTTVNAGILSLSTDMSAVTNDFIVNDGGTLRGGAIIGGHVTVNSGGWYYPGSASNNIGTSVLTNGLTLNAGSTTIATINPDFFPPARTNSFINVTGGTLTYGGNLTIYSIGHTNALQAGQTFQIFPPGGVGNFASTNFNSIETQPGVTVSFADGLVTITAAPANPSMVITNIGGGVFQINWDSSFYKLQWQTNAADVGLSDNWISYPTFFQQATANWTNDLTIPATFFRLAPKP